eukprot:TRINITY_DN11328_c0_g1_i1.p1 TRINITY_DN11328_c0_g1~~TRINITY_DN11328_c0_g1_i1.p1  ORF type:complete len:292 (-),score=78.60 TRINITY_DN11328_c0_g1_i1:173-1048(-)
MTDRSKIIDGKAISNAILDEIKTEVATGDVVPCIAVIIVGERKDSQTYVRMKIQACERVGIKSIKKELPAETSESDLIKLVTELNNDPSVHGILVQLPLPANMNANNVLSAMDPEKDVDGFNPIHLGSLGSKGHTPMFVPCTPQGCMELLKRENISVEGKRAVVIGRSTTVGLPLSLLLINANATVTVCHSKTKDMDQIVKDADLVFAAVGIPCLVKKEWVKPGAVCIDVGINSVPDSTKASGYKLVGDIDPSVAEVASKYTPVPGGVGPMTVAMLLKNTLESAKRLKNSK